MGDSPSGAGHGAFAMPPDRRLDKKRERTARRSIRPLYEGHTNFGIYRWHDTRDSHGMPTSRREDTDVFSERQLHKTTSK